MSYDPKLCEAAISFDPWRDRGQCSRPHKAERNGRRVCTQHARARHVPVFVNRPEERVRATVRVCVSEIIHRGGLSKLENLVRSGIARNLSSRALIAVVESSEGEVVNQAELRQAETGIVEAKP